MNALIQSLENMPAEPSTNTLRRLAGDDYVRNLPEDFWSPVFGQARNRDAYDFNFEKWQAHYHERKTAMQRFFENWLRQAGTILESFSDDRPTADFTEAYRNGCPDTLWNVKGHKTHGYPWQLTRTIDLWGFVRMEDRVLTIGLMETTARKRIYATRRSCDQVLA